VLKLNEIKRKKFYKKQKSC